MSTNPEMLAAEARVQAARSRLFSTLGEAQTRLKPANLAHEAIDTAKERVATVAREGAEAARARPVAVAAVAGAIGLVVARGWIFGLFKRRRRRDETRYRVDGLITNEMKPAQSAKKGRSK